MKREAEAEFNYTKVNDWNTEIDKYERKRKKAARAAAERYRWKNQEPKRRAKQEAIAGRRCPDVCDICGESARRIVFDHCHAKGRFRGWLCDRCNPTLGGVKDSTTLLAKMIAYLER